MLAIAVILCAGSAVCAEISPSELFTAQIHPTLTARCLPCHNSQMKKGSLDLSTREAMLRGGDSGPAVMPGKALDSELYKRLRHESQPGMPYQSAKLSDELIAKFKDWIDGGAPYDASIQAPITAAPKSTHWAFQVPRAAPVPAVKNRAWVINPIDAFIAAEQEKRGLKPLPAADQRTLLRRVYLDLIGLPPTPDETRAFLADRSADAYEKVVDRLLADPRYGERWGRHWMDIWRYSDWYGRRDGDDQRNSARHIWHWRDWIIESLNRDKGYDRMIVEMLAADEVEPTDTDALRATGYLARDFYRFNRNVWMQDTVEHTSAAFLGITMKCARCHDHKYDPISQEGYYRFRAFFEPYHVRTDRIPGQPDVMKDGLARVFDAEPREATTAAPFIPAIYAKTYRLIRGDDRSPDTSKELEPGVPAVLGGAKIEIKPVTLPLEAYNPDLRPFVGRDLLAQARADIEKAEKALSKAQQDLAQARSAAVVAAPRPSNPAGPSIDFRQEIRPILEKNCSICHSAKASKSGLAVETVERLLQGGAKSGPAVIAGNSKDSPLIQYLRGEKKPAMPFGMPALASEQIARIAQWIDTMPDDPPDVKANKAAEAVRMTELDLAAKRAYLPALEARLAADQGKFATPVDQKRTDQLAEEAQKAEQVANRLQAEEDLARAQAALAASSGKDDQATKKRVAEARKRAEEAAQALGRAIETYTPVAVPAPQTSTGRRTALALWIAGKQNPLTARVAINHMWLRHFGKPLVPTVVNFGQNGKPASHPELLDWLAVRFMQDSWSMKRIHRLMVTSATYRLRSSNSSADNPDEKIDPENRYLWRMNPRRLEAETVRDSLLYLAGELDTSTGGPDIDESEAETRRRRSLYFRHTPDSQVLFLKLFDQPDPTDCYQRNESIVPQQALAVANSNLSFSVARQLARRIDEKLGGKETNATFIQTAFETVLGQPPDSDESGASEAFLRREVDLLRDGKKLKAYQGNTAAAVTPAAEPAARAREDLVHALLNHSEFVTLR
jgi:mono/diheme cytochrome c family protein